MSEPAPIHPIRLTSSRLKRIIREHRDQARRAGQDFDPSLIADEVIDSLTEVELMQAAEALMPMFVSHVYRQDRSAGTWSLPDLQPVNGPTKLSVAEQALQAGNSRAAATRQWRYEILNQPYQVKTDDGLRWIYIGAMTPEQVQSVVTRLETVIDHTQARANRLRALADAAKKAKVKTIGELPDGTLRRLAT